VDTTSVRLAIVFAVMGLMVLLPLAALLM